MSTETEPLSTPARMAEPVEFPAPRDPWIQDHVEDAAERLQATFPYRTLLDCRQLAARLVDEVLTWDAMWPEAEGDCGCAGPSHRPDCLWNGEEAMM